MTTAESQPRSFQASVRLLPSPAQCISWKCSQELLQHVHVPYAEKVSHKSQPDRVRVSEVTEVQEQARDHRRQTLRHQVSQVPYKPARRPTNAVASDDIEFVVDGERGIRLSDALEEHWVGLRGRDDRSLFECDRLQIMLRFQVRRSLVTCTICF